MSSFLESEENLRDFIARWERGELTEADWTHAAHIATCAYYSLSLDQEAVYQRMRDGILFFNSCVGTPNTEDRGYHETLTRFWVQTVFQSIAQSQERQSIGKVRDVVQRFSRSSYCLDFYSFNVIKDREARRRWIPPDRVPD